MESKRTSEQLGPGVTGGCELLMWVLGSELGSSRRKTNVICCFKSLLSSGCPETRYGWPRTQRSVHFCFLDAGIKVCAATLSVLNH